MSDVIRWHQQYPDDWKQTWFECEKKWSTDIGCPEGVFVPYNIDATINSAYILIGLLYGEGISTRPWISLPDAVRIRTVILLLLPVFWEPSWDITGFGSVEKKPERS